MGPLRRSAASIAIFPVDALDSASLCPRFLFGAVAQLEERYNGIVEVVGSIPIGSTI